MFRSLQKQIILVLTSLVLILFLQVFLSRSSIDRLISNQNITNLAAYEINLVHQLERDIIDLQRNLLVYKGTASQTSITNFKKLMDSVDEKLDKISELILNDKNASVYQDIIKRMRGHLSDYSSNFLSVIEGRTKRDLLFNNRIKLEFQRIISETENTFASSNSQSINKKVTDFKYHLISAKNYSYQYLISPDYELVEQFNFQLDAAKKLLITNNDPHSKTVMEINQLKKDFFRLTQITSGYVFLVNVVMAGSANEFLYLAKKITQLDTEKQAQTNQQAFLVASETKQQSDIVTSVLIALSLLGAIFTIGRIIIPVRKITDVFNKLSEGEAIQEIPGIGRGDEIGELAQAAHVFHDKNLQTSMLLDRTQKMNAKLEKLSIQAQQASKAKGEFVAGMSHEIRTPLNGVMGMLGLLTRSNLDNKQKHYANLAKSSADSLLTIVNDILDFSKIEAGKLDLEIIDFNLTSQLTEFVENNAFLAQEKGLELILDTTQICSPMVKGDPSRLRQVLNNLLSNAVKFTEKGEILIRASLIEKNDNYIFNCEVIDTGIGIAKEKLDHLFESFTQADASTTRKYGGTGLGLTIAKQICELMDGTISVKSQQGKGSCFEINVHLQKSVRSVLSLPNIDLNNLNFLIVDANQTNRKTLRSQLEMWGGSIQEASDGIEAINLINNSKTNFSVAFINRYLPKLNGTELGHKIKNGNKKNKPRLIMMTLISERGDAKFYAEKGFDAYFPKPVTAKNLYDSLMVVLKGGQVLDEAKPLVTQHYLRSLKSKRTSDVRILIVDDNQINLEVTLGVLDGLGYSADTAADGMEAIEALKSAPKDAPYHIVLMDCQMPVMDGYKASAAIRSGEFSIPNKDIPIIAMTANAMQGDKEKCLMAGMNDYLSKPISRTKLIDKLEIWTNSKENPTQEENSREKPIQPKDSKKEISSNKKINPAIWDRQEVLDQIQGKTEVLAQIIDIFPSSTIEYIKQIKESSTNEDFDTLVSASHSLKGVSINIGGLQLYQLCKELELAAENKNTILVNQLLPMLIDAYERLLLELSV